MAIKARKKGTRRFMRKDENILFDYAGGKRLSLKTKRCNFKIFVSSFAVLTVLGAGLMATFQQSAEAIQINNQTCECFDGVFTDTDSGPAALTADDQQRADLAYGWMLNQMKTSTAITSNSVITLNQDYPVDNTGSRVQGTYTLAPGINYADVSVRYLRIADIPYVISTVPATGMTGTFDFARGQGNKMVRLIDNNTGAVLAEAVSTHGLIRSFEPRPGEINYGRTQADGASSYDQGISVISAIAMGDQTTAKKLTDGLLFMQAASGNRAGGFIYTMNQLSAPQFNDQMYRLGAHAVATYALLTYIQQYPSDPDIAKYTTAAEAALDFIKDLKSTTDPTTGLYRGGYGQTNSGTGVFDPNYVIQWANQESNQDTWHTFLLACRVFGDQSYCDLADQLLDVFMEKLWNEAEQRINQAVIPSGPDTSDPLDSTTWGSILLSASDQGDKAAQVLTRLPIFQVTDGGVTGYKPYYPGVGGYPGAVNTVWFEGSFGAALAHFRVGDFAAYRQTLDLLMPGQLPDGAFRYVTTEDARYEMTTARSVSGTAWYILATQGRNLIWQNCIGANPVVLPPDGGRENQGSQENQDNREAQNNQGNQFVLGVPNTGEARW